MRDALCSRVRRGRRNERCVVRGINELPADADEEQHNRHFQNDNESVDERRFLRPANEQQRQKEENEKCGHVHDAIRATGIVLEWRMRPLIRKLPIKPTEDAVGVFAPRVGDGRCGDRVFED